MELYLIRHPQPLGVEGICYGQSEWPVPPISATEIQAYREYLPSSLDAVWSSPSSRCKVLAEALFPGQVQTDARLMEMNFGDWEGRHWNALDSKELEVWMQDFVRVPASGGEALMDLSGRVQQALQEVRRLDCSRVLWVTHAGPIRCVWAACLGIPLENIFRIRVEFREVHCFELATDSAQNGKPNPMQDRWVSWQSLPKRMDQDYSLSR